MSQLQSHLREVMEESGFDPDEMSAVSDEQDDGSISSWYQECAIFRPWRAFRIGVGTYSGWSREEAIALVESRTPKPNC